LRLLRDTERISFILTGLYPRNDNKLIDFIKICDYLEEMVSISRKDKKDILERFTKHHTRVLFQEDIKLKKDVLPQLHEKNFDNEISRWFGLDAYNSPHWDILFDLIDTPRNLKML